MPEGDTHTYTLYVCESPWIRPENMRRK